ncbi:type IV pilin protein [Endozoicomonas sp. Mp262]|uniref:type IV pilin protein n=1 Tax=Endozoicomonas sp. Mp262 TaxID=2919499 RepID=UPI0021D81D87
MKRTLVLGFSFIEVIITLVIIAILSAIAYPSYQQYVLETRRSDAYVALTVAAAEQERLYTLNHSYVNDIDQLGDGQSPEGFYDISVVAEDGGYTLTAEPVSGGVQAQDTDCLSITLDHLGNKLPPECW